MLLSVDERDWRHEIKQEKAPYLLDINGDVVLSHPQCCKWLQWLLEGLFEDIFNEFH